MTSGFFVEATDGGIGKVDEASNDVGASYILVDTGPWIFGKKVLMPAGLVREVDLDSETVFVDRSKDEIKDSPEFDPDTYRDCLNPATRLLREIPQTRKESALHRWDTWACPDSPICGVTKVGPVSGLAFAHRRRGGLCSARLA